MHHYGSNMIYGTVQNNTAPSYIAPHTHTGSHSTVVTEYLVAAEGRGEVKWATGQGPCKDDHHHQQHCYFNHDLHHLEKNSTMISTTYEKLQP